MPYYNWFLFIVVLGFLSYVGGKGSVYISELVKEFSKHSHEKDVNSMLESVISKSVFMIVMVVGIAFIYIFRTMISKSLELKMKQQV